MGRAHEDNIIINLISESPPSIEPATIEEVHAVTNTLHKNKAPDVMELTNEHYIKLAKRPSAVEIREVINFCFSTRAVSDFLKHGIVTPIYKKGDQKLPTNYRGITVTSILLKLMEHIINKRQQPIVDTVKTKKQMFLVTLDAQKAIDVVNHEILLRYLIIDGVNVDDWVLLTSIYTDMTSSVKWK